MYSDSDSDQTVDVLKISMDQPLDNRARTKSPAERMPTATIKSSYQLKSLIPQNQSVLSKMKRGAPPYQLERRMLQSPFCPGFALLCVLAVMTLGSLLLGYFLWNPIPASLSPNYDHHFSMSRY